MDIKIWVDADACPVVIKEILFRAAMRMGVMVTLIANQPISVPTSPHIKMIQVEPGFDIADNEIVKRTHPNDLVITADIPLAAEIIKKGAIALSPRGELLTQANIGPRLNIRDFLDNMRASGIETGGPAKLNQNDRKAFANHLNKIIG